ncbi:Neuroglobin [Trichostrongylus colubriformis]|uniref:Neuroglobin n=1 Tax=Trichostrongylus colubriformis TaxID=6319 RepID=A0AAN8IKC7_TRICO
MLRPPRRSSTWAGRILACLSPQHQPAPQRPLQSLEGVDGTDGASLVDRKALTTHTSRVMTDNAETASICSAYTENAERLQMDWYPFTVEEQAQLLRSWKAIESQKQAIGCDIYEMIFNQCPEARKLFPKMKFVQSKPDKKSCEFAFQAMRFIQVIEGAVMSLDDLPALNPILDNLGRRHGKLEINGKFRTYYWSTFLECCICILRKMLTNCRKYPDKEIDSTIILWRYLLRDMMKKIKSGYDADISNRMQSLAMEENRTRLLPSIRKESYTSDSGAQRIEWM